MTDQTPTPGGGQDANTDPSQPVFQLRAQYLRDLSYESPNLPQSLINQSGQQPPIAIELETGAKSVAQNMYEVGLVMNIKAGTEEQAMFLIEINYAGLIMARNIPMDRLDPLLGIEGPRMLYPFVRHLILMLTREGGFPGLFLQPIDFTEVYRQRRQRAQQEAAAGGGEGQPAPGAAPSG